jgi:hypothetical protein
MSCLPASFSNIGKVLVVTSSTRPTGTNLYEGRVIFETDTNRFWYYSGTAWILMGGSAPRVRVTRTGTFSLANNTNTTVLWDSEVEDADAFHSTSVNTSRLTVPTGLGGIYHVGYQVDFPAAANITTCWLIVNGAATRYGYHQIPNVSQGTIINGHDDLTLAAGDYVELQAYQNSGGAINAAGVNAKFWAYWRTPS